MYSASRIRPNFVARQMSVSASSVTRAYGNRQSRIAELQEQLATGKRINRPSDDPAAFGVGEAMESSLRKYEQYERTVAATRHWLDESESAMTGMSDILATARESGIRSINATLSQDDLEAVASQVEGLLANFVDRLNSKAGNEYVFAGGKTTTTPFVLDNSAGADVSGVTYYGDDRTLQRTIGDDFDVDINISGTAINTLPSGDSITGVLSELATAIRTGDADVITTALEKMDEASNHVLTQTARMGGRSQRMTVSEGQLKNSIFLTTSRRSEAQDADIAETVSALQLEQLRMQAATQALLSIRQLDITNFL